MLCRALFAAIVVSYVLCVLLMSGVHKEDLDAQTLRKLQQHNVNIADIDNQKLREQCFMDNYVSSLTTDRVDLKEHRKSRQQPAFVDENGATKAQLTRIIDYLKNQDKHKKEITTKSVVATDSIDLNSLFSLIKNISVHESVTEASTDSPLNVTKKDSAKPTLNIFFEYFKKQAENTKQTTKSNVVHTENLELTPLNTRIKKSDPEKPITKEQLQGILDDYFKKKDIKDTTSRPVNMQSGTTTKSNIAELSSLLSNKNHDIEFIADSVSHITLKSGKAKDRENISFATPRKENKSREVINTNKTLPETSNQQMKPQVLNDIEYVSNIVVRILRQKQQNQALAATINSNEKKCIRDIETVEDQISDIKTTTPTIHVLNNYNLTENVEILDTVDTRSHNKENDLINALLKELRNRDRLLTKYKEETSSNYDQYIIDNRNQKQSKNSLEEESKGTIYKLRGTSNQAAGIFSRLKNRPVIDASYKSKQPFNIHSWSKEEGERKPFSQPSERGKTNMQNTINEYYPEANRHHKRKWVYFEEREQTPEPKMEQKTDIRREPYNTMNNENDRTLDNAYKSPWQYFSNRQNSKEINPSSNKKNGLERQFKSITNTINNENYPNRERKPKYAWPVYYEDPIMAGNLQLQNNNALVNKPNELKKPENKQERIPTDRESPLMEPVLSKWFKNTWQNPQSETSFKKEPKSTEELTKDRQFFKNRKPADESELQLNNDNVLFENKTLYDNLKIYLMDEKVKNLKEEIEKNDDTTILNVKDHSFSPKILKQIADTVKAIVLEDLKKDKSTTNVFSTTPSTTTALTEQPTRATATTTTTTATTTTTVATTTTTTIATTTTTEITSTTPKEEQKLEEASKALEKFMKVFEKFKLLKYQFNLDNVTNQQNLDVVKEQNFQVFKPPATPSSPFVYVPPQLKRQKDILDPFTDKEHWIKMQIQEPRRYPPVMIQTNLNEIPPLRLTLERPVLFNTVLLTTRATPLRYDQAVDIPDKPPRSVHKSVRAGKYTRVKPEQNSNDDQPRDKYEESFKPRHIGNIGKTLGKIGKDYFHNVKKIHEKIEREERPPRSSKKCTSSNGCPDKISQRKQRPLGRGSNFDDKHFKNFLKTQQKVNAMLERILATKAKQSRPMSTEII